MHRKFIALIVSSAILVTGFSAAPARAGDAEKLLGGLAAIAILGAAVRHYDKKKDRRRAHEQQQHVTRNQHKPHGKPYSQHRPRPVPPAVARYDLPGQCLKPVRGYGNNHSLLKPHCLQKNYRYSKSLPPTCKVSYWNGERRKSAYEPRCLRQHGYRVVHHY